MVKPNRVERWVLEATPYEVASLAIQMERGAARRYAQMAKSTGSALVRAKMKYLAEEEREHRRLLSLMRHNMHPPCKLHPIPPDHLSEVTRPPAQDSVSDTLKSAIKDERSAEAFYRHCAKRCRRARARELFRQLADREAKHRQLLQDELDEQSGAFPWRSLEGGLPTEEEFWS